MSEESYVPSVDPSRIDKFYADLQAMNVDLDADPLALGPKRINSKIAECRRFLSLTERMFTELSQDIHYFKREHRRASVGFDLMVQELISSDPETRAGRSVTDRIAVAHIKLRKERDEVNRLQFAVDDLDAVLQIVRAKRNDLKDISSRLRDQLKVCQEEIGLGGRWGSYRKSEGGGSKVEPDLGDDVIQMLDDALKEVEEAEVEEEETDPSPEAPKKEPPTEDPQQVEAALEAMGKSDVSPPRKMPVATESDSDLDALLSGVDQHLPKKPEAKPLSDASLDDILMGLEP